MGCDVRDSSKETAFYRSALTVSTLPFIWRENVLSPRWRALKGEGSLLVEEFSFVELRWKWHCHMHKKSPQSAPPSYWPTNLRRFQIPSWDKFPPGGKGATTEEPILIHVRRRQVCIGTFSDYFNVVQTRKDFPTFQVDKHLACA